MADTCMLTAGSELTGTFTLGQIYAVLSVYLELCIADADRIVDLPR